MAQEQQQPALTPEDEIRILEAQLEQKKRDLAARGESAPPEKDVFKEVLREHIEKVRLPQSSQAQSQPTPPSPQDTATKKAADDAKALALEAQVRQLVEIAMTRGIQSAVSAAQSTSPYLLDELHDHLVDDYYEKLIALRKLKEL